MTKQNQIIYDAIINCIEKGLDNKVEIYTVVEHKTGFPRPTIRRASQQLREKLSNIIKILEPVKP